jgi:hypothetical protein
VWAQADRLDRRAAADSAGTGQQVRFQSLRSGNCDLPAPVLSWLKRHGVLALLRAHRHSARSTALEETCHLGADQGINFRQIIRVIRADALWGREADEQYAGDEEGESGNGLFGWGFPGRGEHCPDCGSLFNRR